jgi:2-polyprenyl-3-methyl-5-hydroxy-6-metoxy-1,4-benzoquinol methylase
MDAEQIAKEKQEHIKRLGPWTAHCIHLTDDIYTFDHPEMDPRLRSILQISADITGKPLHELRVLDLACLEGHFGIEFALHGSQVVAVEGREANLEKARFATKALGLHNIELVLDDVRNVNKDRYGLFDVVLCLGILYHLDTPDVMNFVENIATLCNKVAVIDTHISSRDEASYNWNQKIYWGQYTKEHVTAASSTEKLASAWNSLDNSRSFQFTRASLCNLLRHVHFTSVYECLNPYQYHNPNWPLPADGQPHVVWNNRITLAAIKGQNQPLLSSPVTQASPEIDRPEKARYWEENSRIPVFPATERKRSLRSKVGRFLPNTLKRLLRKIT